MSTKASTMPKVPVTATVAATIVILAVMAALVYVRFTGPGTTADSAAVRDASNEAKAYVAHLQLSDVRMQATENFMNQQVVEVQGTIANTGPRPLQSVDVYCLFSSVGGQLIRKERLPIVHAKGTPLRPGEVRPFRLPFDSIPEGWNQAMPHMVIARISFAE